MIKVETSTDGLNYTTHAEYEYYETGALKRTVLAEGIQGIDYIYTLGGRIKQINHPSLKAWKDPGDDSNDLFGVALDYFQRDYTRAGTQVEDAAIGVDQFNGNIKAQRWNNGYQQNEEAEYAYAYRYNDRNWLTSATYGEYRTPPNNGSVPTHVVSDDVVYPGEELHLVASSSIRLVPGFHAMSGSDFTAKIVGFSQNSNGDYKLDKLTYDANGNIQSLRRKKDTQSNNNEMHDLEYVYKNSKPNQLSHVNDFATSPSGINDLEDQSIDNYIYNEIGQLVYNDQDDLEYIYTVSGLVSEIKKEGSTLLKFYYNDKNHRIRKDIHTSTGIVTTWYVRDNEGTPLSVYSKINDDPIVLEEHTIYGVDRIGVMKRESSTNLYELEDHLGNIRGVIIKNGSNAAALTAATDYFPFGMPMPNRNLEGDYRYAYQGQEKDEETDKEAFELRIWDGQLGRWLTTDPEGQHPSPYLGMGNNPISRIDPDGGFDWYKDLVTGEIKWFDGSFQIKGYENLGSSITMKNHDNSFLWYDGKTKSLYKGQGSMHYDDVELIKNFDNSNLVKDFIMGSLSSGGVVAQTGGESLVIAFQGAFFALGKGITEGADLDGFKFSHYDFDPVFDLEDTLMYNNGEWVHVNLLSEGEFEFAKIYAESLRTTISRIKLPGNVSKYYEKAKKWLGF